MDTLCITIVKNPVKDCRPIKQIKVCKTIKIEETYCVPIIKKDYTDALNRLKEIISGVK